MHKDFYKTNANLDHKKCVLRLEAGDWEVCFQLLAEENSVNIKQLWVKNDVRREKIESSLARRAKVWIVASKFENVCEQMHLEIWYAHITLNCFCSLRAKSV